MPVTAGQMIGLTLMIFGGYQGIKQAIATGARLLRDFKAKG